MLVILGYTFPVPGFLFKYFGTIIYVKFEDITVLCCLGVRRPASHLVSRHFRQQFLSYLYQIWHAGLLG